MKNIIVIGGGPSGMMAAYHIKKNNSNFSVILLEKDNEIGKRIKISGNGRCNFSNANISDKFYKNGESITHILNFYKKYEDDFLKEINLHYYQDEEGRKYPVTNSSKTFHNNFVNSLNRIGVKICTSQFVNRIVLDNNKYNIITDKDIFLADKIVISSGGLSYLYKELDGEFINRLNVNKTIMKPSLCPIKVIEKLPKDIVGKRSKADVKLILDNNIVYQESGEILFKKDGLSGIVIFNISSYIASKNIDIKKYQIEINFINSTSKKTIDEEERIFGRDFTLKSYVVDEIANYLNSLKLSTYSVLSSLKFHLMGSYDFRDSQVTSGGISLDCIDINSLSLKSDSNIYVCGEVLDVDGRCGGYNIYFAMASGFFVANNIK